MDTEERALLNAIIAHPDEDTPRLMYADWLQEHDRPERAEYIRLSIQLANLCYGDPNFEAEEQRLLEQRWPLVNRFHKRWEREFATAFPPDESVSFVFNRGFIEYVSCSVPYLLDNAEQLFARAPIRWLRPSVPMATVGLLRQSEWFPRLHGLQMVNPREIHILLEEPVLPIRAFNFSYRGMSGMSARPYQWEPIAQRLAEHSGLKALKYIDLERCHIGDAGGLALADSPHLDPSILNLLNSGLSSEVQQALRNRYGPRVWLDRVDRNGSLRGF